MGESPINPVGVDWAVVNKIVAFLVKQLMRNRIESETANLKSWLSGKKGALGARYRRAMADIERRGFDIKVDSKIKAFVKLERYYKLGKAPRLIMGRNPKFNILYSEFIKEYEGAFFKLPQVANACDFLECGEKFEKLLGEWMLENDMEAYESTQWGGLLFIEYLVMFEFLVTGLGMSAAQFDDLFIAKVHKRVNTGVGISAGFEWCRGSGDMDTSTGNGTINYVTTMYQQIMNYCPNCPIENCPRAGCVTQSFCLKGDDSYMKIPRNTTPHNYYANFGLCAKMIVRRDPLETEFCSGHFIEYRPGKYIYAQKLQKLCDSLKTCINTDIVRRGCVAHYYKSIGMMYAVLYGDLPIYSDIARFLMTVNVKYGLQLDVVTSWNLKAGFEAKHKKFEVDASCALLSISNASGFSYAELDQIRVFCNNNKFVLPESQLKRFNPVKPRICLDSFTISEYSDIPIERRGTSNNDILWYINHDTMIHNFRSTRRAWNRGNYHIDVGLFPHCT